MAKTEHALGLTFGWPYGTGPWNSAMDDNLVKLGAVSQISVTNMTQSAPPVTYTEGERFIVGPSPTGAFAANEGFLAVAVDSSWKFYQVQTGWNIFDESTLLSWTWNGFEYQLSKGPDYGDHHFFCTDTLGTPHDMSDLLLAFIDDVGATGGGRIIVHPSANSQSLYLTKKVSIYHDNVTLDLSLVDVLLDATGGCLRISGSLDEYSRRPGGSAVTLRSGVTTDLDGKMVLPLTTGHGTYLSVGDKIIIRGQNDATGRTLEKQTTFVQSISGDDVTCTDEPLFIFSNAYPGSDWPADATTGTTIYVVNQTALSVNSHTGNYHTQPYVTVADPSLLTVGDLVLLSDTSTEYDVSEQQTPGYSYTTLYRNPAKMEFRRVVAKNGNDIYFDGTVKHPYLTSMHASVAKVRPVVNSHIIARNVFFNGIQMGSYKALEISYGDRCSITLQGKVAGQGLRMGDAMRCTYSYDCDIRGGYVEGAGGYGSGQGYGVTLYYSTRCRIRNVRVAGCRHNFLIQASTDWEAHDVETRDDVVSGFDVHGCNSRFGLIDGIVVSKNDSLTGGSNRRTLAGVTTSGGIRIGNNSHAAGDKNITIRNVKVSGYKGGSAMDFLPPSSEIVVENAHIYDADIPWRYGTIAAGITPTQTLTGLTLKNITVERCGSPYVVTSTAGQLDTLNILNYTEYNCATHLTLTAATVTQLSNVTIDNYKILGSYSTANQYGISVTNGYYVRIRNCDLNNSPRGIYTNACQHLDVYDNRLDKVIDGTQYAIVIDGSGADISVGGNFGGNKINKAVYKGLTSGSLASPFTTTSVYLNNDVTPVNTGGAQIVSFTYDFKWRNYFIGACVPYMALSSADTVTMHLFVDGNHIATWSGKFNSGATSGMGATILPVSFYPSAAGTQTVELRIGTSAGATLTLNNKFNGMSLPYITFEEIG